MYGILEFDPLLDSSNMDSDGWIKMAQCIGDHYQRFDGFVILHGTDTMAYTSSALAFMLEGLGKSVVVTGGLIVKSWMLLSSFRLIRPCKLNSWFNSQVKNAMRRGRAATMRHHTGNDVITRIGRPKCSGQL